MTICAVSTPAGCGGIAVIRISGPSAIDVADRIWTGKPLSQTASHTVHLGNVLDRRGDVLDQAVATVFHGPKSFTGEDVVELSVHGSLYVQQALLESLMAAGARIAEPGEFTRRAFSNGRLDLAEAEAVADIIASSSRAAHSLAVSQLQGRFSKRINQLRDRLITLASLLELELDFSEEDVTFADRAQLKNLAEEINGHIGRLVATFSTARSIMDGVPVAIVGRPNAGKSSLLNALLESDRAIVSDIPGTTRDTVEETADIDGILFRFIDTAGLRETDDPIESLGIDRAYSSLSRAVIVLWLVDPDLGEEEKSFTEKKIRDSLSENASLIILHSKSDLRDVRNDNAFYISASNGEGLDTLKQKLFDTVSMNLPSDESVVVTNARHQAALLSALSALNELLNGLDTLTVDLLAEHLREAIRSLGEITGEITSDTILHTIFQRFCIGK